MGNYSAAMLAEVTRAAPKLFVLVNITFPSGIRRYAALPVRARGVGQYQGRITSLGNMYTSVCDLEGNFQYPRLGEMVLEDTRGDLGYIFEIAKPEGSLVEVYLAAKGVDEADWLPIFGNGRLDNWRMQERFKWTINVNYNDTFLRTLLPRTPILRADFPRAASAEIYTYHVLLAYGIHDSRQVGDNGMCPTFCVDTVNGWYGPWLGWVDVERVYVDGVNQTSGWSEVHTTINGREYTLIDFTTPPDVDAVVTADIEGYKDGVNGTGDLITGADALSHLLINFAIPEEDWKSGAWFTVSGSDPISSTHFGVMQTFLEQLGWERVSKIIGGIDRITGETALNTFCHSFGKVGAIGSFATLDGKIALMPNDWRTTILYHSGLKWIRYNLQERGSQGSFSIERDRHLLADRVNVHYLPHHADGQYKWALEVRDLSIGRNLATDLELPWSHAQVE